MFLYAPGSAVWCPNFTVHAPFYPDSCLHAGSGLQDNIFEWHYTLRGPSGTEFANGLYHGRIQLPAEYPFRPPNMMVMTPNGRWELNKKVCTRADQVIHAWLSLDGFICRTVWVMPLVVEGRGRGIYLVNKQDST